MRLAGGVTPDKTHAGTRPWTLRGSRSRDITRTSKIEAPRPPDRRRHAGTPAVSLALGCDDEKGRVCGFARVSNPDDQA